MARHRCTFVQNFVVEFVAVQLWVAFGMLSQKGGREDPRTNVCSDPHLTTALDVLVCRELKLFRGKLLRSQICSSAVGCASPRVFSVQDNVEEDVLCCVFSTITMGQASK